VPVEFREADDEDPFGSIEGFAARYYRGDKKDTSLDLGGFRERLRPGAFTSCLARNPDVSILRDHKPELILGRTASGTARVWEHPEGLKFRCSLPNTTYAQDLRESIKRGDVTDCSFGFICDDDEWGVDDVDGERCKMRTVNNVQELLDCSVVARGAYPSTSVSARMWPGGMPASVRSHVDQDVSALASYSRSQRQKFTRFLLG